MKVTRREMLLFPCVAAWGGWIAFEFLYLPMLRRGLHLSMAVCLLIGVSSAVLFCLAGRLRLIWPLQVWSLLPAPLFVLGFAGAAYANLKLVDKRFQHIVERIEPTREALVARAKVQGWFPASLEDLDRTVFAPCDVRDFTYSAPRASVGAVEPPVLEFPYSGGAFRSVLITGIAERGMPRWVWYDYLTGVVLEPTDSHVCWKTWSGVPLDECPSPEPP
ncbi:MAG: hypothetical protein HY814_04430 [Candidatus Riflebacteria bacterium]|nr:hypothetical protein [Candidatus Riflebacteria bacterium]